MRINITATGVALGLFFCASAHAGFRVDSPAYRPKVHPGGSATHVGVPDSYTLSVNKTVHYIETIGDEGTVSDAGFGHDVPLSSALNLMLPDNWLAYTNPKIDDGRLVSWGEGQTWMKALRNIAVRNDLRFFIDFNKRVARVELMPGAPGDFNLAANDQDAPVADPASDDATDEQGIRGDAFPKKEDGTSSDSPDASTPDDKCGTKRTYTQTTTTDETGAPVTKVFFHCPGAQPDPVAADESYAYSPGAEKTHITTTSEPTPAQVEAHKKELEDDGRVAEFDDTLPWYKSRMSDNTEVRQLAGTRPEGADLTLSEFYAQPIVINVEDVSITEVVNRIAPVGWEVDVDLPAEGYATKNIARLTAERSRGELIAALQRQLNIKLTAYPVQHLVVVTDR